MKSAYVEISVMRATGILPRLIYERRATLSMARSKMLIELREQQFALYT
jgi:hypothetical protein